MSKLDAQRAMREARYAALQAQPPVDALPTASPPAQGGRAAGTATGLCGHRSIGNKSCKREAGHPEKAHRYK